MQGEQRQIAAWVNSILTEKGWSLAELGRAANVDATTIGRAADADWKSVTSVKTLEAIARAAGRPSLLALMAEGPAPAKKAQLAVPSVEALRVLLSAVLPLVKRGRQTDQSLQVVSEALHYGLELLGDQIANPEGEASLGVAARAAVARFRDLTQQ